MKELPKDLAMPEGLSEEGKRAWKAITDLLAREDATYTGGCKGFYSPKEWTERGEEYGQGSVLVVAHDGGEHAPYFSYDCLAYEAIERMRVALEAVGCWPEQCTTWYSAVYRG
jgi:hypothetical protein